MTHYLAFQVVIYEIPQLLDILTVTAVTSELDIVPHFLRLVILHFLYTDFM